MNPRSVGVQMSAGNIKINFYLQRQRPSNNECWVCSILSRNHSDFRSIIAAKNPFPGNALFCLDNHPIKNQRSAAALLAVLSDQNQYFRALVNVFYHRIGTWIPTASGRIGVVNLYLSLINCWHALFFINRKKIILEFTTTCGLEFRNYKFQFSQACRLQKSWETSE